MPCDTTQMSADQPVPAHNHACVCVCVSMPLSSPTPTWLQAPTTAAETSRPRCPLGGGTPVLLNGQDVLSTIKEQASINAEQASINQELQQVNANLSREIASLHEDVCRLREPHLGSIPDAGSATHKWADGVLAPNGLIYSVPYTATSVLIISPTTNALDTTTIAGLPSDVFKWWGGVLAPSNNNI